MKPGPKPSPRVDLFTRHIDRPDDPDDCIPWKGAMLPHGYGKFGRTTAHRSAYILFVGDPGNLVIDHLCRNRACVNPAHLEAVPQRENTWRGALGRLRTHCHRGHEITPATLIVEKDGKRRCRICKADKMRRANERFVAQARRSCVDCGKAIGRRGKRCPSCSAVERESRKKARP